MRIPGYAIPVKMDVPGATVRQLSDFGTAAAVLGAEHLSLSAGTDIAPLLQGLEEDLCQSPHWGYVVSGRLTVTYGDGQAESCATGDLVHWPAGHSVRVDEDAEVVLFSPQLEHLHVLDHMLRRLATT
ncbi:MAG TPA: cupin domain-containing protein [Nocardioides sp.]|nr:cupin domain-containing protein [Nocardioides sp.]